MVTNIDILSRLDAVSSRIIIHTLDKADPDGLRHAYSVAEVAFVLAGFINAPLCSPSQLWLAGLLHDIGKLGIPKTIVEKSGALTKMERASFQQHSKLGKFLLDRLFDTPDLGRVALYHHEWFDGTGYPNATSGDEIPISARIVSVADAYDTMRSAPWLSFNSSHSAALRNIEESAGRQFDPAVVAKFVRNSNAVKVVHKQAQRVKARQVLRKLG